MGQKAHLLTGTGFAFKMPGNFMPTLKQFIILKYHYEISPAGNDLNWHCLRAKQLT